jgi:glycosyltransferase involved in cell wall biosynthesis
MEKINLSLIIPVYNEEDVLEKQLAMIDRYLSGLETVEKYEIIASDNGSTDKTPEILNTLMGKLHNLRPCYIATKGLGCALREGISQARYEAVMFMSIDVGFGLEHINECLKKFSEGNVLVIGSKNLTNSIYKAPLKRKAFSFIYNHLIRLLFGIKVTDTQGTFMIDRTIAQQLLPKLTSDDFFFQTQLVTRAILLGARYVEIPVVYYSGKRLSKVKMSDAFNMLAQLFIQSAHLKKG